MYLEAPQKFVEQRMFRFFFKYILYSRDHIKPIILLHKTLIGFGLKAVDTTYILPC